MSDQQAAMMMSGGGGSEIDNLARNPGYQMGADGVMPGAQAAASSGTNAPFQEGWWDAAQRRMAGMNNIDPLKFNQAMGGITKQFAKPHGGILFAPPMMGGAMPMQHPAMPQPTGVLYQTKRSRIF